jgi:hypothetical protein
MDLPQDLLMQQIMPAMPREWRWTLAQCSKKLLEAADKLALEEGLEPRRIGMDQVFSSEELMQWACRNKRCKYWIGHAFEWAARNGRLDAIAWLHAHHPGTMSDSFRVNVLKKAAEGGHLDVLKFMYAENWPGLCFAHPSMIPWHLCFLAAENGDIPMLQWLRQTGACGAECDSRACWAAARSGHLATLKWLREQDPPCQWCCATTYHAALRGDIAMLQWAIKQGCPVYG